MAFPSLCVVPLSSALPPPPPHDPPPFEVYQIAGARTNPVTLGEMTTFLREAFQRDSADLPGRTWQDRKFKWTPPRIYERNVERARRRLELLRDLYSWLGLKRRARRAAVRLRLLKRMAEFADVYGFYVERGPEFETENSRELLRALHPIDRDRFSWDIDAVAWRDYFLDAWVPGLMNVADDRPAGARVPGADATSARGQSAERTSDEPRQVSA